jgi:glycosyltransferase involved in cell wall biosynthesis
MQNSRAQGPMASVVMSVYNRRAVAEKTIQSILQQNVPVQIILVDDGSTDDTSELRKLYDIHYLYLHRPYFISQGRALNLGIRAAISDVIILQSGDVRHDGPVVRPLAEHIKNNNRDWVFAFCDDEGPAGQMLSPLCSTKNRRPLGFLSALHKKWLCEVGGYDEDWEEAGYEDDDLAHRLIDLHGLSPVYVDHIRGVHQWHGGHVPAALMAPSKERFISRRGILTRNTQIPWGAICANLQPETDPPSPERRRSCPRQSQ